MQSHLLAGLLLVVAFPLSFQTAQVEKRRVINSFSPEVVPTPCTPKPGLFQGKFCLQHTANRGSSPLAPCWVEVTARAQRHLLKGRIWVSTGQHCPHGAGHVPLCPSWSLEGEILLCRDSIGQLSAKKENHVKIIALLPWGEGKSRFLPGCSGLEKPGSV